ncbi:putative Zn finger protein [Ammoniphilus resinae]|uniref:Zn finger protein n=2 Tax=Ammoniphilus resinae TaxID=861532 RepID=A0ABS4GTP4_9BACL|nr:putative Zn finger protein [Ammoniphilus resinae]
MNGRSQGSLSEQWNRYWDELNHDSPRKKGGTIQSLVIDEGKILATVCGLDCEESAIYADPLSDPEIENILQDLYENRSILLQIYRGKIDTEELREYGHRFGLEIPPLHTTCTCQAPVVPCGHLQSVVRAAGEVFSKDLLQFLRFRGIKESQIFAWLSKQKEPGESGWTGTTDFGLIPLPSRTSEAGKWMEEGPPPFWTSSFSFPQMMREIYGKVREEARKK